MIETRCDFKQIEERIYKKWLPYLTIKKSQNKNSKSKDIVFLMAPPNITGALHLGHSIENTIIDILVRYYRMKGLNPVWLPGIDHAGIATHNVVEKELLKNGISRFDIGREKFVKRAWEWKEKYGNLILEQFKKLGITPDWSRVKFTMDKNYVASVEKAFVEYYKKGLIYRDLRPINFCTRCKTGLSDLELEWKLKDGKLYYIKYPLRTQNPELRTQNFIVVATTRPETMLGDTAIAVNPRDERYKKYTGEYATLPIINRKLLIVSDQRIDPKFGTGAVKVTPAHSIVDYEISKRHNLELLQVIDENGKIIHSGEFNGMDCLTAREKILEKLEQGGFIEKIENYEHEIPYCDRCKTEIQVVPSVEWFVKMKELADLAKKAVKPGKVSIIPFRYKKPYFDWLKNVRDWCISRKLWWGQQLPVWFCQNQTGKIQNSKIKSQNLGRHNFLNEKILPDSDFIVSISQPKICPFCKKCKMKRTEEVFDTWFSSALWPFAILYANEEKKWYPAFMVSSARDILHLWITRMIFSGLFFKKNIPFEKVFIHPVVQTKEGKRMSKSAGVGIDPLTLIDKYGADALRFGLIWQMSNRQDLRFDENFVITGKKFATKIWNAARFYQIANSNLKSQISKPQLKTKSLSSGDKKIVKEFNLTLAFVEKKILEFQFSDVLKKIYKFFWNEFCGKYLESCKKQANNPEILKNILENSLKLINIFMPFITEELWSNLSRVSQKAGQKNLLLFAKWPQAL